MKLNNWNKVTLNHIHPFNRNSQDINALLFYFQCVDTKKREKTTFNIPANTSPKYRLIEWLKKMRLSTKSLDLKNPNNLIGMIMNQSGGRVYEVYVQMSKNKKYVNIEDIRIPNIKYRT